jgi:chromosomal replication initiator protein
VTTDPAPIWTRLQAELRRRVSDATYDIWLAQLGWGGLEDDDRVLLQAPADVRDWLGQRFGSVLGEAARAVLGPAPRSSCATRPPAPSPRRRHRLPPPNAPAAAPGDDPRAVLFDDEVSRLNPKYTFEQFVIGDANRFAHAAALAVAELPGQAYNPLFIVGPARRRQDASAALDRQLRARVRWRPGRPLHDGRALHQRVPRGPPGPRRRRLQAPLPRNDVLLIDDVQFLESKVKTEEEFFHTFNALHETGSQLVLTSDRPPRDMAALEDRLRQRFESGLLVDIRSPDPATRLTVLRKRAHHDGVELADDGVLELIAERVTDNLRSLEAALIRVVAYASLTDAAIDRALADQVLTQLYGRAAARGGSSAPTVERIQSWSPRPSASPARSCSPRAGPPASRGPRQVAMYLAREHTQETLRPSAPASAAATTPPSCTPASVPPTASAPTPTPMTP